MAFFAVFVPALVTALTRCGRRDREDSLIRALRAGVVALAASPARTMGVSSSDEEAATLLTAARDNKDRAFGFGAGADDGAT